MCQIGKSERVRACALTLRIRDSFSMWASSSDAGRPCIRLRERVTGFEPANACLGIGRLSDHPHALLFPEFTL